MREMTHAIFDEFLTNADDQVPGIVTQSRDAYKRVSDLLDKMPEVLEQAHNDAAARWWFAVHADSAIKSSKIITTS